MYKVVFFDDADGTLLSEIDRSMHESTKEAIRRLIDKGIHVVVTTGRPYSLCSQFKELGINTFISANGAHIKCGKEVIHKSVLSLKSFMIFQILLNYMVTVFYRDYNRFLNPVATFWYLLLNLLL